MEIQVINKSGFPLPATASQWAAGLDVRAKLDKAVQLAPFSTRLIPTGLFVAVPNGFVLHVTPRSGLALKEGITVFNSPGKVDADYRGEVGVVLYNGSPLVRTIEPEQRIAQISLQAVCPIDWVEVEELEETTRGAGGFGSTGKQ